MSSNYYESWNSFNDEEEKLHDNLAEDESNIKKDIDLFMDHHHDHQDEIAIFSLPESEKMKLCENHRVLGNYLYKEGLIPKACENYHLVYIIIINIY